jgi:hypothetical protein
LNNLTAATHGEFVKINASAAVLRQSLVPESSLVADWWRDAGFRALAFIFRGKLLPLVYLSAKMISVDAVTLINLTHLPLFKILFDFCGVLSYVFHLTFSFFMVSRKNSGS